jgi:hypothetical protein
MTDTDALCREAQEAYDAWNTGASDGSMLGIYIPWLLAALESLQKERDEFKREGGELIVRLASLECQLHDYNTMVEKVRMLGAAHAQREGDDE